MSRKRDHLNDCLERMFQGEELESCLKDYPEEAEELRLLLTIAGGIKRYIGTIKPRPEFVSQTQANLEYAYKSQYLSWKVKVAGVLNPVVRFAAITVIIIVLLVSTFAGGATLAALASENAMPGETLYPVKLFTEQIRISFALSDESKVDYLTHFAETRVEEIVHAAAEMNTDQVEAALESLEQNLTKVEEIVTPDTVPSAIAASQMEHPRLQKIESTVQSSSARAHDKLREFKEPDPDKREMTVGRVGEAYSKAIKAIEAAKTNK